MNELRQNQSSSTVQVDGDQAYGFLNYSLQVVRDRNMYVRQMLEIIER